MPEDCGRSALSQGDRLFKESDLKLKWNWRISNAQTALSSLSLQHWVSLGTEEKRLLVFYFLLSFFTILSLSRDLAILKTKCWVVFLLKPVETTEQKEGAFCHYTGSKRDGEIGSYVGGFFLSVLKSKRNYLELTYSCKYVVLLNYAGIELNYFIILLNFTAQDVWILLFPSTISLTLWNLSYLWQLCLMPQKFCIFSTNWVFLEVEFNRQLFLLLYKRITKSCRGVFYTDWTRPVFNTASVKLVIWTTGFSIEH